MEKSEKKVSLLIDYQWNNGAESTAIINKVFDSYEEAWAVCAEIMPQSYYFDDGTDVKEWDTDDDPFEQYAADITTIGNSTAVMLAVLRPVDEEE